jgi:L-fuconolactonase
VSGIENGVQWLGARERQPSGNAMLIVDAQVHIWAASTPERPWPTRHPPLTPHRPVPFSKDDLLRELDAAGVHRAVIVPPRWDGERNDLGLEAARLHPGRLAVMGRFDINAPGARRQIANWRRQPGMLGVRFSFKSQDNSTDNWLWTEAEASGVPIMVSASTAQLHLVDQAAERHPGLKLVIDHLGIPAGTKDDEAFANLDQLLALAKRPNIAAEASSLPSYTTDSYPYRRLHQSIRRVYDAFGPKRMLWGSDLTKLPCSYHQAITMFTEEIPWFTAEDKEWIMGRGLCEWLGWTLP